MWKFTEKAKKQVKQHNEETIKIIESNYNPPIENAVDSIKDLYRVSDLDDDINIVEVPSVIIGAAVNCAASYFWFKIRNKKQSKNSATDSATASATISATDSATASAAISATISATDSATRSATASATISATDSATISATASATRSTTDSATASATDSVILATISATRSATDSATISATHSATDSAIALVTDSATRSATNSAINLINEAEVYLQVLRIANKVICRKLDLNEEETFKELLKLSNKWYEFYNGGCEWASWPRYTAFVRDHCDFQHESHKNFKHYEDLLEFGPRFMHKNYVLICKKIKNRHKNNDNLLHNENGPAIEWHCGTKRWYINGVLVDQQTVEFPESITVEQILKQKNADFQRVMLDRMGVVKFIKESNAQPIDSNKCEISNTMEQLYEIAGNKKLLVVDPSGEGIVILSVPNEINSCQEAQNWLNPFEGTNVILAT